MKPLVIETFKGRGKQPWRYRIVSPNGQVIGPSEGYATAYNRDRAAFRFARHLIAMPIIRPERKRSGR